MAQTRFRSAPGVGRPDPDTSEQPPDSAAATRRQAKRRPVGRFPFGLLCAARPRRWHERSMWRARSGPMIASSASSFAPRRSDDRSRPAPRCPGGVDRQPRPQQPLPDQPVLRRSGPPRNLCTSLRAGAQPGGTPPGSHPSSTCAEVPSNGRSAPSTRSCGAWTIAWKSSPPGAACRRRSGSGSAPRSTPGGGRSRRWGGGRHGALRDHREGAAAGPGSPPGEPRGPWRG
jgi:hypothetical protein